MNRTACIAVATLVASVTACTLLVDTSGLGGEDAAPGDAGDGAVDIGDTRDATALDASDASDASDAGAIQPYVAAVLADQPLLYYRFEETSGISARDGMNRADGEYIGTYVLGGEGVLPGTHSLELDGGGGGVDIRNVLDISGRKPVTFESWYKPSRYDTSYRFVTDAVRYPNGRRDSFGLPVHATNDIILERWVDDAQVRASAPLPTTGVYHHVVATYDGDALRLYVDAKLVASAADARPLGPGTIPLFLGKSDNSTESLFGLLDEVAIYDKALEAARITAHYGASGK
jgi:hypothetical protein